MAVLRTPLGRKAEGGPKAKRDSTAEKLSARPPPAFGDNHHAGNGSVSVRHESAGRRAPRVPRRTVPGGRPQRRFGRTAKLAARREGPCHVLVAPSEVVLTGRRRRILRRRGTKNGDHRAKLEGKVVGGGPTHSWGGGRSLTARNKASVQVESSLLSNSPGGKTRFAAPKKGCARHCRDRGMFRGLAKASQMRIGGVLRGGPKTNKDMRKRLGRPNSSA